MYSILIIPIVSIISLLCLYVSYLIFTQICCKNNSESFCSASDDKSEKILQSDYLKFNNNFEEKEII